MRVVNTCCVTAEAVAKSRKAVRRAARTAERVLVTGCAANLRGAGARRRRRERHGAARPAPSSCPPRPPGWVGGLGCAGGAAPAFARTRAYVKVQDGCSFACSYCVIPQVRGAEPQPRRPAAVLAEVARRAAQGHREVVLTGINLGCFRDRAAGMRLADLIVAVAERRRDRARAALVDRGEPPHRRAARRPRPSAASPRTCTCRCSRATTPCCGRCGAATPPSAFLARMQRARERVAGREPDHRRDRRPSRRDRGRVRGHAAGGRRRPGSRRCTCSRTRPARARPTAAAPASPLRSSAAAAPSCGRSPTRAAPPTATAKRGRRERVLVETAAGPRPQRRPDRVRRPRSRAGRRSWTWSRAGVEGDAVVGVPA